MDVEFLPILGEISSAMTISIQGSFLTGHGDILLCGIDRGADFGHFIAFRFLIRPSDIDMDQPGNFKLL